MIRDYLNVAISLLSIGLVVALTIITIEHIQKKQNHALYKKFIVVIAIVGATIGALIDSFIGPYLASIRERLLNIHPYTPAIVSIICVLLFKKVIERIES